MRLNRRFSLRVSLVTLIGSMLLIVVASLAWYNYEESSEAAIVVAHDMLEETNNKVHLQLDALFKPVLAITDRVSELPYLATKPQLLSHPATRFLLQVLESSPSIYSVYIGYSDGEFYQILQALPDKPKLTRRWGAPKSTRFAIRRILYNSAGRRVEIWKFLDESHRVTGSNSKPAVHYDPRRRPWYRAAVRTNHTIKTEPYLFTSTHSMGMTVARRFDGDVPGVFGVDITLDAICDFLAKQHVSEHGTSFLFDSTGHLIAHPSPDYALPLRGEGGASQGDVPLIRKLRDPVLDALYERFDSQGQTTGGLDLTVNGKNHIARINEVPARYMKEAYVAVVAPRADFTKAMVATRNNNLIFALIILAVAMPLVVLISGRVSISLRELAQDSEEIRKFELDTPQNVASVIREIDELAVSMRTMKGALRTFGQYMPKSLVSQIVTTNATPVLGGHRQPITLLFTDVANFTSMSERMDPEALMLKTSEYFQTLGSILLDHGGTIDKFIGDAIMAFWNAPVTSDDHVQKACSAALAAAHASNVLGDVWSDRGEAPFYTRFGVHTGECIVGNVGSSDRMNYTAMGEHVNMAARLEGLCKYLHTQILVSEQVADAAGDGFLFRPAGRVVPKGATKPVTVYELVGSLPGTGGPCETDQAGLEYFRRWEEAYEHFMAQRFHQALALLAPMLGERREDGLLQLYLARAKEYSASPPGNGWNGVEHFTQK